MEQKISAFQGILLIISTITPTAVLTVPNIVVRFSGQDAWISIMIAAIAGIGFAAFIGAICRQNRYETFPVWLKRRLGAKLGTVIGILLTYYYFVTLIVIVREFVNFLAENVLTRTPVYILIIMTVAVVLYAVGEGIEVIARINLIVVLLSLLILAGTVTLLVRDIHPRYLLPVWDHPAARIIQGSIVPASWFSEVAFLLLLAPFMNRPGEAGKAGVWGIALAVTELCMIVATVITVFGPRLVMHMSYPTFTLMGIIQITRFLERIDILFISIWICLMYLKMAIFMFGAFHCFVQTCRIRSEKPFLLALGLLTVMSSIYTWPRTSDLAHFTAYPLSPYLFAFNVLLPLVIWLCLCWRKPVSVRSDEII
ncbi:endospore germination permease [Paenibacillus allorhizosphaerae]|uniref:Spore germination protein YndE n=1 Tax=Paenibacillus allorhizosphaerae TaxID=2849866 RepID=A0ABM8VFI7_9BACL|nr:endospore germination permease [Paenibacillus allorhizosphaerae]CAG7635229.1 Spore germination protein YndE [Paenibacillus allorhizosphaerae]